MSDQFSVGDIVTWSNGMTVQKGCKIVETRPLTEKEQTFIKENAPDEMRDVDLGGPVYRCVDTDGVSFTCYTSHIEA